MDSLGGILTNGLLGNLITARFGLFTISIEEEEPQPSATPTPTPSPSATLPDVTGVLNTVTPTPTPVPSSTLPTPTPEPAYAGGGRSHAYEPTKKTVRITIRYKTKEYSSVYTLTDKTLRVTINTINHLKAVAEKLSGISLKLKKKEPTVKVKRHDD